MSTRTTFEPNNDDILDVVADGVVAGSIVIDKKAVGFIPDGTHVALMTSVHCEPHKLEALKRAIIARVELAHLLVEGQCEFVGDDAYLVRVNNLILAVKFVHNGAYSSFALQYDAHVMTVSVTVTVPEFKFIMQATALEAARSAYDTIVRHVRYAQRGQSATARAIPQQPSTE